MIMMVIALMMMMMMIIISLECMLMSMMIILIDEHDDAAHDANDSLFSCDISLGEDGPTHQPVEMLECLRAHPNMHVFRPADGNEV